MRAQALHQHQNADRSEKDDIEQRNDEVELALPAEPREDEDAERGPHQAAHKQHQAELDVERAAPEMSDRAGDRRGDHLVGAGRDRDHRWDIVEDQERRDEKPAADAEHAGQKTDGRTHPENDEDVDRKFCDRQVDRHA